MTDTGIVQNLSQWRNMNMGVFMGSSVSKAQFFADLLQRFLENCGTLDNSEKDVLLRKPPMIRQYSTGAALCNGLARRNRVQIIVSGWACREQLTPNGRRQILSLLLPGDVVGVFGPERPLDQIDVTAVTTVRSADLADLVAGIEVGDRGFATLGAMLLERRRAEDRRLVEHVLRLGCLSASGRLAGLLLELYRRSAEVGLAYDHSFLLPLKQELIGNMLGVSLVHVCRLLRQFRDANLVEIHQGVATIRDFSRLAGAAALEDGKAPNGASPSPPATAEGLDKRDHAGRA